MNEPVDWDKPIELMNGTPAKHVTIGLKWKVVYPVPDGFTATTDLQGCIGGVQVVRNRKEPEKHVRRILLDQVGGIFLFSVDQYTHEFRQQSAKLLIWRDETGKTRVEVCDE